ncbi:MAG: hypothetical protein NTY19_06065 [Planctomycetota bacterium]|nr:hypothetical protein [Planctomycetota bacterium]
MKRSSVRCWIAAISIACFPWQGVGSENAPTLRVATFRCDVTPPVDGRFLGGWGQPLTKLLDPLWAKGIVLDDGSVRYVLCAVDWCELCNGTHLLWRRKVAEAAGIEPSRVAIQCVHQHTAPVADGDAQALLDKQPSPPQCTDRKSLEELADRLAAAVKQSLARLEPFDRVGTGEAQVDCVAANRRVVLKDGKLHVRWSSCTDPELQSAPEGLIDPMLKTITLARGGKPLARFHYYATHPQTGLGDGPVSIDFVGFARDKFEQAEGVFQVYFTGCSGNVTAGKYNDGTARARGELTQRLLAAMGVSVAATRFAPAERIGWRTVSLTLPVRNDTGYGAAENREILTTSQANGTARISAAGRLAFHERSHLPIELSALAIGPVHVLHLPGEPFVEFQLYAQEFSPQCFVAVAGYGDGGPGYLCTEKSYPAGGYEPTATMLAPASEAILKQAIGQVLTSGP